MEIDAQKRAGTISPLWFGHNLEHTRSCLWQGLSAQVMRNRKFVGAAGPDGVARHWHRIGPAGCLHMLERSGGKRGTAGETYTAHFDPYIHGCMQRQRIQAFRPGCGIGQGGIFLVGGCEYELRLALRSDRQLPARVRVRMRGTGCFETTIAVPPDEWSEHRFTFAQPATDAEACLEITLEEAGAFCLGAVSLMPADHFHGLRRDVIALLKEIGVPILRWPGGNFAGSYRWRDGLLPVDRRAPLWGGGILPHTDGFDDHEIGTDEFVALCRELGAEPWITINMGLEGPDDAAAWVEYCNAPPETEWGRLRGELGHPEPYGVTYWTLGNEMGWPHMGGPNDPEGYSELAAACARSMKAVDPSIVLVASDGPDKERWYTEVPARAGEWFDHISYHEYTDLMKIYEGDEGRGEFRRIAAAAAGNLRTMQQIRARLEEGAPGGKSIGISFDEWNVWHAWYRVPGVVEGIHAAAMLNMICREARNVGMRLGAYFEPVNEGAIVVSGGGCRLTPAGQVFSLFRAHHGNELLEVNAPDADHELDVVASAADDGRVIITLVNCSSENGAKAEFVLANAGNTAKATGVALTSPDFLPESEFRREELSIMSKDEHTIVVAVPRHSVARIQIGHG